MTAPRLDVDRILTEATGLAAPNTSRRARARALQAKLQRINRPLHMNTIEKWCDAGIIPGGWLVCLAVIARAERRPFNLVAYLTTPAEEPAT